MTNQLSYLLLGEGDFTYSLDMCRYLAALPSSDDSASKNNTNANGIESTSSSNIHHVTCTGVDTLEDVNSKYKDADFILKNLRAINKTSEGRVQTKLLHGVNAVQTTTREINNSKNYNSSSLQHFDHVLFNHPHLGIEDAKLHKRFLLHFFHAANHRWLKPHGGLLHLTLVRGQCERWDCSRGAERHGLVLLRRGKFCPPPPPPRSHLVANSRKHDNREKTYYQLRRHQSGKSFANRRIMQGETYNIVEDGESETIVFGRSCDHTSCTSSLHYNNVGRLPWENAEKIAHDDATAAGGKEKPSKHCHYVNSKSIATQSSYDPYTCNFCNKSFLEQRSLKNHVISSHPDSHEAMAWSASKQTKGGKMKKLKDDVDDLGDLTDERKKSKDEEQRITCKICESQKTADDQPSRIFPHNQALLDHERAKHSGVHLDIKPDWYKRGQDNGDEASALPAKISSCPICDLHFSTEIERTCHELEFLPATLTDESEEPFRCSYCCKSFRERRAQRQHENLCSSNSCRYLI